MADSNQNDDVGQHGTQPFTPISEAPDQDGHVCPTCGRSDGDDSNDNPSDEEEDDDFAPPLLSEGYDYRSANLIRNSVHIIGRSEEVPEPMVPIVALIYDPTARQSDVTFEEVCEDPELFILRTVEIHRYDVMRIFLDKIAHDAGRHFEVIKCSKQMPIFRRHLPGDPENAQRRRISQPMPDLLFGYRHDRFYPKYGFCDPTRICDAAANEDNLILPFLCVEIGEQRSAIEPSRSFYGMENEAAATAAACVKMMEQLNARIDESPNDGVFGAMRLCTVAFSVVTNGSEARLFMAWRDRWGGYTMRYLQAWLLAEEDQYVEFQHVFQNILHWASGERWTYLDGLFKWLEGGLRKAASAKRREQGSLGPASKRARADRK